jgi:hypothetical protein
LNHSDRKPQNRWIIGGALGLILLSLGGAIGFQIWVYEPFQAYYFPKGDRSAPRVRSMSTDTHSKQFATDTDKIRFLRRYLTFPTVVEAAEFHVVYQDNSQGMVPGPSYWDIQAVFKVAPQDLSVWTLNAKETSQKQDLAWGYRLAQQRGWKLLSAPKVYTAAGKIVAVFEKEGFIFKRLATS